MPGIWQYTRSFCQPLQAVLWDCEVSLVSVFKPAYHDDERTIDIAEYYCIIIAFSTEPKITWWAGALFWSSVWL